MSGPGHKFSVLVVDDSSVDRMLLSHFLDSDPRLQVVGVAENGASAIALNERLQPDVIVMDVTMPDMDGLETTARIMHSKPVPIVICTSLSSTDAAISFRAIESGALALLGKPVGPAHPDHAAQVRALVDTVALMAEVKVVKRWARARPAEGAGELMAPSVPAAPSSLRMVVIGTSTGGPPVLHRILAGLPKSFPLPLLIVQHIAPGFLPGMASWLERVTGFPVRIAQDGEMPLPGHAYLAPDHHHLGVGPGGAVVLSREPPVNRLRPAVAHLFQSAAAAPFAHEVIGVLLTGMGTDGAEELRRLRDRGAITIAQDEESSAVHGMPGEAIRLGGARHVLPPEQIAGLLCRLTEAREPQPTGSEGIP